MATLSEAFDLQWLAHLYTPCGENGFQTIVKRVDSAVSKGLWGPSLTVTDTNNCSISVVATDVQATVLQIVLMPLTVENAHEELTVLCSAGIEDDKNSVVRNCIAAHNPLQDVTEVTMNTFSDNQIVERIAAFYRLGRCIRLSTQKPMARGEGLSDPPEVMKLFPPFLNELTLMNFVQNFVRRTLDEMNPE